MNDTVWQFLHKWVMANSHHEFRVFSNDNCLCIDLIYKAEHPDDWAYNRQIYTAEHQRDAYYFMLAACDQAAALNRFIKRRKLA